MTYLGLVDSSLSRKRKIHHPFKDPTERIFRNTYNTLYSVPLLLIKFRNGTNRSLSTLYEKV